jgi:hypothetical protein
LVPTWLRTGSSLSGALLKSALLLAAFAALAAPLVGPWVGPRDGLPALWMAALLFNGLAATLARAD